MTSTSSTYGLIAPTATVRVPQHVVYRPFPAETVVLNLDTGLYHSLNPTGGRMLEVLDEVGLVKTAVVRLAQEYEQPLERVTRDICSFCFALLEQGLIQVETPE